MMFALGCFILLFSTVLIASTQVSFIRNVILVPRNKWNSTTINNRTTQQCLCLSTPFVAFNWLPNNTCQLFDTFPISYRIQSTLGARLYFPQGIFPNKSQCCMPDLAYLLDKLKNGTWTDVNVTGPRNLVLDKYGYLVTTEVFSSKLDRFDARTLTLIDQTPINGTNLINVRYANDAYFAAFMYGYIVVIDSKTLKVVNRINSSYAQNIRDIVFLNNGRTMVIPCLDTQTIAFFNQTSNSSLNYTFAYSIPVGYLKPHGLTVYNDSFFYATSWNDKSVYSYSAVNNSNSWIERLFINTNGTPVGDGGTYMIIDECGRYWFSLVAPIVKIFDIAGNWMADFNLGNGTILDTLIADNYVMYFSDNNGNQSRIIRIDPHIQC